MDYKALVHQGVQNLHPYIPGKSIAEIQERFGCEKVIKLASNENPAGCSLRVKTALNAMDTHQLATYPAATHHPLQTKLAKKLQVSSAQITLSNGSDLLFTLLLIIFALHRNKHMLTHDKAFMTYAIQAQLLGIPTKTVAIFQDFQVDIDALIQACTTDTAIIFLANPNNPTGILIPAAQIKYLMKNIPTETIVVLDEAYYEYASSFGSSDSIDLLAEHPNLVITRTFSKAYGLAGLRLGYSISAAPIADLLQQVILPFSVNQVALEAGNAALDDQDFLSKTRKDNTKNKEIMATELTALGISFIPSQANFLTIYLGPQSLAIFEALLKKGIIVRPLQPYNMLEYLRVTIGTYEQNQFFLQQLTIILQELL